LERDYRFRKSREEGSLMDRVRLGVIGAGNIAQLNLPGYIEDDRCDVVAICDTDLARARDAADRWAIPDIYEDVDQLLDDDSIDAVEILTPTFLHHDHVIAAARAGKHISCQKPMANTFAEAVDMLDFVKHYGVKFRITENYLHYLPLELAKSYIVSSGVIGEPLMLRMRTVTGVATSDFATSLDPSGQAWRVNNAPGGHLFDDGVHKYAVALWLLGNERIKAVQAVVRSDDYTESPAAAIFEYERQNLLGTMERVHAPHMQVQSDYYPTDEFFEVQGTDGLLQITRCSGNLFNDSPLRIVNNGNVHNVTLPDDWCDWGNSFKRASAHFITALLEDKEPDMSGDLALETLKVCFAVYESSTTQKRVVL
jgi:predicted dehydrogenase